MEKKGTGFYKRFSIRIENIGTNLKEGSGKLCAGQTRVTVFDSFLVNPFKLISSENFGLALPIGSVQYKSMNRVENEFYSMNLNAGTSANHRKSKNGNG